jgi:aspartate-semialdehyde dehydrogenase
VGRIRDCAVLDVQFAVLGHNLVRGAAGAAVQLGELVKESRWSSGREGCS